MGSRIGFSWMGLVFLMLLFVPNILWAQQPPSGYADAAAEEPPALVAVERVGEALACVTLLFTRDLRWHGWRQNPWWLLAAAVLMSLYELWWVRYFGGSRTLDDFYQPFCGIPVPGAVLPVAALLMLALYSSSWLIGTAAALLGIGHIGVHLAHLKALGG